MDYISLHWVAGEGTDHMFALTIVLIFSRCSTKFFTNSQYSIGLLTIIKKKINILRTYKNKFVLIKLANLYLKIYIYG